MLLVPRRSQFLLFALLTLAASELKSQAPTPDQRDLGVCPALRPALDAAGPNNGIADVKAARAALAGCPPGTVPTILGTAMVLMAENNQAAARAEVNRAAAIAPTDPYVLRAQCHVESNLREYARAIDLCTQALARRPDWDQALHYRGSAYLNAGRYADAATDLERAVARNPRLPITWTNLFLAYRGAGKLGEAAEALKRAVQITPGDAPRLFSLSEVLSQLGRHAEAESVADQLLARRANAPDFNRRGNARFAQRKNELALADFTAAEAADPTAAYAVFNQGVVLQQATNCPNAMPHYERAARIDTTYAEPVWAQFRCLSSGSRRRRVLNELARRDSTNARVWYELARSRDDSTRALRDSSIRNLDRAIRLDTAFRDAYLERGPLLLANGDHARAVPDLRRAVAARIPLVNNIVDLASALENSGQASEAISTLTTYSGRTVAVLPVNRLLLGVRGLVRLRSGDIEGVRDLAEWMRSDSTAYDGDTRTDASSAYTAALKGGIARTRFERALTDLVATPSLAPAARFMRLSMYVEEGDRRAAYTDFQALSTAPEDLRGSTVIGRFFFQDVGATRTMVEFCRGDLVRLRVSPDGAVVVVPERRIIKSYDPIARRAVLTRRDDDVEVDLRDPQRPILLLSDSQTELRRCG
jgi:tetratricopeptide (TPR) repeat protein